MKKRVLHLFLTFVLCLALLPTTARAADETHSSHAVCGSVDGTTCPDAENHREHGEAVDFEEMYYDTATKELVYGDYDSTAGSNGYTIYYNGAYYLSGNMTLNAPIYITKDVTICLNGHSITMNADKAAIANADNSKLTLCDCEGGGTITHGTDSGKKHTGCGVQVNYGGTLLLYGGSITGNETEKSGAGVHVNSGGSFAMYGGSVTDNTVSGDGGSGAGIYTSNSMTIGGSAVISGNKAPNNGQGAGIYCGGSLSIQGNAVIRGNIAGGQGGGVYMAQAGTELTVSGDAKITGNTAANGGGVYVISNGTLVLQDSAAITGNTATADCTDVTDGMGGVYMDSYSTLKVSGSVQVTGNKNQNEAPSNVYSYSYRISVVGGLTEKARIGVTVYEDVLNSIRNNKDSTKTIAAAEETGWIPEGCFTHDGGTGNGLYGISLNDDGTQAVLRHDHVWKISTSKEGHTFTESCSSCGEQGGSVTLTEPTANMGNDKVYDGSTVWRPTVTKGKAFHIPVTYSGMYRGINEVQETPLVWDGDAAWRDAGYYTITITGGGQTESFQYTVNPRKPVADDFVFTPPASETGTLVYDGQKKNASVRWKDGVEGGAITIYYKDANEPVEAYLADAPANAGDYLVRISTGISRNIFTVNFFKNDAAWTFSIQPADYKYEMPTEAELVYGSEVKMLPKGTGTGVNGETVEGTLEWYRDAAHSETLEQADLWEAYSASAGKEQLTLYWEFTATNTNYTAVPKTGSVAFTIVDPYPQDLRIMLVNSSKNETKLEKHYEERVFYLNVMNASPSGGDITYFESDDEVAKVERYGVGSYKVTIKGAGTTEIQVTAAEVPCQYKATTATCTLTVLPRVVTFGAQPENKIYDGTRDAKVKLTLNNVLDGDEVYVIAADAAFATPDVGDNKMVYIDNVTLGGANARGYVVNYGASQQRPLASILEKTIWLERVDRTDKVYDGSEEYPVSGEVFKGLLPGVTLTRGVDYDISGYFPDADADETDQTVNVFVAYKNNEKTKNYCLDIPNGKYSFPSFARIAKANAPTGAENGTLTVYNRSAQTYEVELDKLLPGLTAPCTYGEISYGEIKVALKDGYYKEANGARIDNGKLLLPIESVNSSTAGKIGTVTVTVTTTNYQDITLTIEVSAANQPVSSGGSSGGSTTLTYPVTTPDKTENGSVTVSPKNASKGDTVTVIVKPDSGYQLDDLTVTDKDGHALKLTGKGNGKYTFTMPSGRVEVKASFTKEIEVSPFSDVATDAYYYEAVKWAADKGITGGIGNSLFGPNQPCTRAQIVTFLWRAAGSPEPKGAASGMTDVVSGSYYEKAVAWAIENGITTGTTASTFSPNATCTRAQAVTFLARALNAKASGKAEFSDVPTDSYFAEAVAWAADNGVTTGIGNDLFGPNNNCTRAQIVTFLWRAYSTK